MKVITICGSLKFQKEMMEIADKVIVLDNGKVVSKGTNEDVFNKSPLYRELRNRTFASISNVENEII